MLAGVDLDRRDGESNKERTQRLAKTLAEKRQSRKKGKTAKLVIKAPGKKH